MESFSSTFSENKNTSSLERKGMEKDLAFLLEQEKEFSSWEEKTDFLKLYFIENRCQREELEAYKVRLGGEDLKEKGFDLQKLYEEQDHVDFIKTLHAAYDAVGQEHPKKNTFGILFFDGRYIHVDKGARGNESHDITLEESLFLLSEYLSVQATVPHVINAQSWLMGNDALREKIGFEKIGENPFNPQEGSNVWGQFVDAQGNFKKKELDYLFTHNEPRYKDTKAKISFKDFMQKYGNQFLDRDFTVVSDFREEQEQKLEQNQQITNEYFKHFDRTDWVDDFFNIVQNLPLWDEILKTEKGKLFFEKIAQLEKEALDLNELMPRINQIKKELDFDSFQQEQREKFLASQSSTEKVYIEKK